MSEIKRNKRNERSEKINVKQNDTKETYMVAKRKWDAKLNAFFSFQAKKCVCSFCFEEKNVKQNYTKKPISKPKEKSDGKLCDCFSLFFRLSARIGSKTDPVLLYFPSKRNFLKCKTGLP